MSYFEDSKRRARAEPKRKVRAEPNESANSSALMNINDILRDIIPEGYVRMSDNPEVVAGVNKIAGIISSMTIHLMENTDNGDVRIRNELSRKLDINPSKYMTRKSFIGAVIQTLFLTGDGNCVIKPEYTADGYLEDLRLINGSAVSFLSQDDYAYQIIVNGQAVDPERMIHFVMNPDPDHPWKGRGYRVTLNDVVKNLKQAQATKKGFMESKWQPSIIVKVDALTEEFASKEGRKRLLADYIENSEAGEPWFIPADQFSVEQVKPLSLKDIALPESVTLDKRTVAAVLDVPPFVVGEGSYNAEEWNHFVNTRIRDICGVIEQELTKKLLISPNWYFRFNLRSLYSYDLQTLSNVGANMYTRGIMDGNEVRDWIGLAPREGLNDLIILENYIPAGMIGDQKKLKGGNSDETE